MFFDSKTFKTLEAGIQTTWLQQQLHMQNIANVETPNYKAKSLVFDDALKNAASGTGPDVIRARVVSDDTNLLQDGNNVNVETENLELYKAYAQYSMLLNKIKGQFDSYSTVLNSNMK